MHRSARFMVAFWVLMMGLLVGTERAHAQSARDAAAIAETAWASTADAPSAPAIADVADGRDALASFESEVIKLVNAERANAGCPALRAHPILNQAAKAHSQDMVEHNYVDHVNSAGETPGERVSNMGYVWEALGENVAAGYVTPEDVVAGWMNSEGHRKNILNCGYLDTGVGYVYAADTDYGHYWTQLFGRQPGAAAPKRTIRKAAFLPLTVKPTRAQ